ncbi:MAG: hypothetical protein KF768_11180 [Phycisphaeraceae bacterium]|nr:hypothetical protein [Phycisphaeraceae bacterium]
MTAREPLQLFQAFGIELEYMIVDEHTLDVRPIADKLLAEAEHDADLGSSEVERPEGSAVPSEIAFESVDGVRTTHPISWSNELTAHVIELKTSSPVSGITPALAADFLAHVQAIDRRLARHGARLLGGGMHPWMDPFTEKVLWPHGFSHFYNAFDRVFDCRGHGWANLQSMHINLPFADDEQFGRLHAAIRLLLPILPALAASSPIMDGRWTGLSDNRLEVYKSNAHRVPSVSGRVIPEPVFARAEYDQVILQRIYNDIAPHDPDAILRFEWLNARGAIARFDRNAIEIRVLDVQECPIADLAIAALVVGVLKRLCAQPDFLAQSTWEVEPLLAILNRCIHDADRAAIDNPAYADALCARPTRGPVVGGQFADSGSVSPDPIQTAGQLWVSLFDSARPDIDPDLRAPLDRILRSGPLAARIARQLGVHAPNSPSTLSHDALRALYTRMADCLRTGSQLE